MALRRSRSLAPTCYLLLISCSCVVFRGGDSHFITRNPDGTFKETVYQGYFDLYAHRGVPIESYPHKDDWYRWAFEEGQLECAWNLAARTAKIIGVDEMRFDIFLAQGHPHGCQVSLLGCDFASTHTDHLCSLASGS